MDAGDIAEALFEISIGVICILASIFGKNDQSKDAKFIRRYGRQLLVIFGVLSLYRGSQEFIKGRVSKSDTTPEMHDYSLTPDAEYGLDDPNNPIYQASVSATNITKTNSPNQGMDPTESGS